MPGLAFFRISETLFMPGEKHAHCIGERGARHTVNRDRHAPRVEHDQLEVALQARAKDTTWRVDYIAHAHIFSPEAFVIDHRDCPARVTSGTSDYKHLLVCVCGELLFCD